MRPTDYFTTEDMNAHGKIVWNRVRAKLRAEGHSVVSGYGEYAHAIDGRHFIELGIGGNLVHTKDQPKGVRIDIAKFLGADIKVNAVKINTGNDKDVIRQAFQHLVGLGFGDRNRGAILNPNSGTLYGLIVETDGIIYSVQSQGTFDDTYRFADEIVFDVEVKTTVSNFRPKRKQIEVFGFTVYEDEFMEALKKMAIKSAT